MPLWASYLVKAYAWRGMLSEGGLVSGCATPFGLDSPGYGLTATVITLAYLWLPFMILPIYAGLERLPDSLLEASSDLGGVALDDDAPGGAADRSSRRSWPGRSSRSR